MVFRHRLSAEQPVSYFPPSLFPSSFGLVSEIGRRTRGCQKEKYSGRPRTCGTLMRSDRDTATTLRWSLPGRHEDWSDMSWERTDVGSGPVGLPMSQILRKRAEGGKWGSPR
jgi:hypothetical protein